LAETSPSTASRTARSGTHRSGRVEAHLISLRRQQVRIPAAGLELILERDEAIWTESSYKYDPDQVLEDGKAAGFSHGKQWVDADARFALTRFTV
jgi:uncharacterized SAM-dependent methyltransferase